MRILFQPQFSMRNYKTGNFSLLSDAHYTRLKPLFRKLERDKVDFLILLPQNRDYDPPFPYFENGFFENVAETRIKPGKIAKAVETFQPDLIWTEVPEMVGKYRELTEAPILASFEHIEEKLVRNQVEGFLEADLKIFPTSLLFMKWVRLAKKEGIELPKSKGKIAFFEFFFDFYDIRVRSKKKNSVAFISRLTDKARCKTDLLLNLGEKLTEKGYYVTFFNPTSMERPKELKSEFLETPLSREEYLFRLSTSEYVIIPYSFDDYYSVGMVESIASGCKLLSPRSKFFDARKVAYFPFELREGEFMEMQIDEIIRKLKSLENAPVFPSSVFYLSTQAWLKRIESTLRRYSR